MDLRNFIKETLVQIAQGVDDAREALADSKAIVNPRNFAGSAAGGADAKVVSAQQTPLLRSVVF